MSKRKPRDITLRKDWIIAQVERLMSWEVLLKACEGRSCEELSADSIADKLGVHKKTVERQLRQIRQRHQDAK